MSSLSSDNPAKGILFMLLATLFFAVADAFGKLLTEHYPFLQVVWLRTVFGIVMISAAILATGRLEQFRTSKPGWHLARSLVGIVLTLGIFAGLKYIPLAEVTALVFANPLIIAVYSSLVLKEKVVLGHYVAIVLGFIGVLLVVRPTPDHFHFAHLLMLGFACASAFLIITARRLIATESVLTLNLYVYPATLVLTTHGALSEWVAPDLLDWALFLGVSFFATIALYCVTQAMHLARPSQVVPFDYARILWTLSIGFLFWGELPDWLTWIGILIIVSCGLYIIRGGRTAAGKISP